MTNKTKEINFIHSHKQENKPFNIISFLIILLFLILGIVLATYVYYHVENQTKCLEKIAKDNCNYVVYSISKVNGHLGFNCFVNRQFKFNAFSPNELNKCGVTSTQEMLLY